MPKRLLIQCLFFFAQNPVLKNFFTGEIYRGKAKSFCTPGLNCYSCPAAVTACPIGAAQLFFAGTRQSVSLFVAGFLVVVGAVFGRFICGYLCPMGLFQDLIYKIKTPKLILSLRIARYVKYIVLVGFVIVLPLMFRHSLSGLGEPWFCKYICPTGTIFAAFPILANNETLRTLTGGLFALKLSIAIGVIAASTVIFRFFCRVICPLGAFYSLFNPIAVMRTHCDRSKCTSCRACADSCNICINPIEQPNSPECIRCGTCISKCKVGALRVGIKNPYTNLPQPEQD